MALFPPLLLIKGTGGNGKRLIFNLGTNSCVAAVPAGALRCTGSWDVADLHRASRTPSRCLSRCAAQNLAGDAVVAPSLTGTPWTSVLPAAYPLG